MILIGTLLWLVCVAVAILTIMRFMTTVNAAKSLTSSFSATMMIVTLVVFTLFMPAISAGLFYWYHRSDEPAIPRVESYNEYNMPSTGQMALSAFVKEGGFLTTLVLLWLTMLFTSSIFLIYNFIKPSLFKFRSRWGLLLSYTLFHVYCVAMMLVFITTQFFFERGVYKEWFLP
ncbi:MAG: hypothetical protein U0Y96_02405 [Candidatus Kapaibacterium sp.]|nr:hypothetical protein [Bacteroidota bacterium]